MAPVLSNVRAGHRARLSDLDSSAPEGFEMDSRSIVKLLRGGLRECCMSKENPEASGTPSSIPLVPGTDWYAGLSCVSVINNYRL